MQQIAWLPWIVVGAAAGWLASVMVRSRFGRIADLVVGIGGALVGGFLSNAIGVARITSFNGHLFSPIVAPIATSFTLWSVLVALTGAVTLLAASRMFNLRQPVTA